MGIKMKTRKLLTALEMSTKKLLSMPKNFKNLGSKLADPTTGQ